MLRRSAPHRKGTAEAASPAPAGFPDFPDFPEPPVEEEKDEEGEEEGEHPPEAEDPAPEEPVGAVPVKIKVSGACTHAHSCLLAAPMAVLVVLYSSLLYRTVQLLNAQSVLVILYSSLLYRTVQFLTAQYVIPKKNLIFCSFH